ncbi:MAG TPA: DUF2127 domain-containing protein [Microbacteriaceae bacterium]|nr:DUF2127 domain-containing protein [Microbacteriaceae bacterium]
MRRRVSSAVRGLVMDWLYLIGVVFKGLDAILELAVGIPLLFISHVQLLHIVQAVTAGELVEDPHDFLANLYLHEAARIGSAGMLVGAIYLVVHGGVKLPMVIALVRGSKRAYPWAVGVLSALLVVQIIDLALHYTTGVLLLSVLDAVIIALFLREWRHHRPFMAVLHARASWLWRWRTCAIGFRSAVRGGWSSR